MNVRKVLRRPLLTEKATIGREVANEYAFEVEGSANKIEIKSAIEQLFNVKVKRSTGQLENTAKLMQLRRDIARVETVLREKRGAKQ